jgi:hypothetical protein
MGFRFRRRVRIMPGLYVNISKSGVSTSIGRRGATLNVSKRGMRTTLGLPGTGLSWRSPTTPWQGPPTELQAANDADDAGRWIGRIVLAFLIAAALVVMIMVFKAG